MGIKDDVQRFLAFPFSLRQKRLARARQPLSESAFVRKITAQGGDEAAAVKVWSHLADWIYVRDFTPYPDDNLERVFGIAEEELDEDLILAVLNYLNVPMPSKELLSDFGAVDTPLRIALLIALCRRRG